MFAAFACLIMVHMSLTAAAAAAAAAAGDEVKGCSRREKTFDLASGVNRLPTLVKQDEARAAYFTEKLTGTESASDIRTKFYRMTSQPLQVKITISNYGCNDTMLPFLQTHCTYGKNIGAGSWLDNCGFLDGEKYVCLDTLASEAAAGTCLVYSFGVGTDVSFENAMADLGCRVRAFDPTTEPPANTEHHPNVTFHKIGIAHFNGNSQVPTTHCTGLLTVLAKKRKCSRGGLLIW
jgi:hypothetical protein